MPHRIPGWESWFAFVVATLASVPVIGSMVSWWKESHSKTATSTEVHKEGS